MSWDNRGRYGERDERFNRQRQNTRGNRDDRGWIDKASDEVSSWFGDEDAWRRRQRDERADGNYNEYDENSYHSYQGGYTPKEANPFYPTTNRIYDDSDNSGFSSSRRRFIGMGENRDDSGNRENRGNRRRDYDDTRAGDLMSRNVSTVLPNDTAQQAARIMRDEDCGALPVVDRMGRIIGMVTDRDITIRLVASGADPRYSQVQDCMTDEVFACHVNDSVEDCMREMSRHQVRRMPIVNDRNQVLGIVSQSDLARHAEMNRRNQNERRAFTDMLAEVSEPSDGAYR